MSHPPDHIPDLDSPSREPRSPIKKETKDRVSIQTNKIELPLSNTHDNHREKKLLGEQETLSTKIFLEILIINGKFAFKLLGLKKIKNLFTKFYEASKGN